MRPKRWGTLIAIHDPQGPPEATLVLAAVAAFNGLDYRGQPMPGRLGEANAYDAGRLASLREIARELDVNVKTVRRGAAWLEAKGIVRRYAEGVDAVPEALAARAAADVHRRHLVRLSDRLRSLGIRRPNVLLFAGLVAANVGKDGALRIGMGFLTERMGLERWAVERARRAAERAGAVHGKRYQATPGAWRVAFTIERRWSPTLGVPVPKCRNPRSRSAGTPGPEVQEDIRIGTPDSHPDQQKDAPVRCVDLGQPRVEPSKARPEPQKPEPKPQPQSLPVATGARPATKPAATPQQPANPLATVEAWAVETVGRGIETLDATNASHRQAVASLLQRLDPVSTTPLLRERLQFAGRLCRWAGHAEKLARWLSAVLSRHGAERLVAYLRTAAAKGDPGTVLARGGGELSPPTEQALEGPQAGAVAAIVAGVATVLSEADDERRAHLRAELQALLLRGNLTGAGRVLRLAVGQSPDDATLAAFIGTACTLKEARMALSA